MPVSGRTLVSAILVMTVLAGTGAYLVREATPFGSGLRDDSFAYLSSAEGLSELVGYGRFGGDGTFRPMTSFPPLYSTILAPLTWVGLSLQQSARLVGGLSFAALIFLTGMGLLRTTRSLATSVTGAGLVLASGTFIELHSWALSEGVFFVLALACLFVAAAYLRNPSSLTFFVSAGLASLAFLTRYAGAALLMAVPAVMLVHPAMTVPRRVKRAIAWAAVASAPIAAFVARNLLLTGNAVNRPLPTWHPPDLETLAHASATLMRWAFLDARPPASDSLILISLIAFSLLFLIGFAVAAARIRQPAGAAHPNETVYLVALLSAFALAILLVLYVSMALFDRNIVGGFPSVNERLLSPAYLSAILLVAHLLGAALRSGGRLAQAAALGVAVVLLVQQASAGSETLERLQREGLGFSSPQWRSSQTLAYVRDSPPGKVFTNDVPALYLLAGRSAFIIPSPEPEGGDRANAAYRAALQQMWAMLAEEDAILVIVGPGHRERLSPEHLSDLTQDLILLVEFGDGLVYGRPGGSKGAP